ncbi:MAG: LysE family translocator [Shimia sp.]
MTELSAFLPGILAAYAILLVGASSPGPAVALLLGIGSAQGRRAALITTCGISCGGAGVLNLLVLFGMGVLMESAAWSVTVLRYVGAAYLLWLAYGAFKKAAAPPTLTEISVPPQSSQRLFLTGLALQTTNPKSVAFWVSIHAVSGIAAAPIPIILGFFAGAWLISFGCHGAWGIAFSSNVFRSAYTSARRYIEAALGGFLAFMAFTLAANR